MALLVLFCCPTPVVFMGLTTMVSGSEACEEANPD